jgi:pimeloyl-ACP methyl ester carboxylesterase
VNNVSGPRLFFFTGLGADERAFSGLKITVPFQKIYVAWLPVEEEKESLIHYVKRLVEKYHIRKGDILIGLSFGGFVVTEINRILQPSLSILISSASTRQEMPFLYRIAGRLGLDGILPCAWLNRPDKLKHYFFGLKTPEQKKLFAEILSGADPCFMRWAVSRIVRWQNLQRPESLYKIHGTADRIIPLRQAAADFIIPGGSHFLTWEKAAEVSEIINRLIRGKYHPRPLEGENG